MQFGRCAAAAAALVLAACGGGDVGVTVGVGAGAPDSPPQVALRLQRVFESLPAFSAPVALLQAPGDASRWFVVEQGGRVRVFPNNPAATASAVFGDISSRVVFRNELGLLGMAFHPNFPADRRVYLFYSHNDGSELVSRLSRFFADAAGQALDASSERILITIRKPIGEENHNGGNIAFGPDGFLYAGIGDGGGANDQHGTIGNAQSTRTLHGKMLRIDVTGDGPFPTYAIPAGNPFAGFPLCSTTGSSAQSCPEIFALGFRNPWRWSFDRLNGQLWVGDVGQNAVEEVDRVVLGGNFGWRCFEGRRNTGLACGAPPQTILPVAEYGRAAGSSVTGGFVYRGSAFPALAGRYVFADFVSGLVFNIDAAAQPTLVMGTGLASGLNISSFGQDLNGELYVVHYGGQLFRIVP